MLTSARNRKRRTLAPTWAAFAEQPTIQWLLLAVVFLAAVLLRIPIAGVPLERDEGEYAYIAQRWLDGEVPYRDSFDQKPPAVFVAYLLILKLIGASPAAIHWGTQLYTLGTLAILFTLGRHLFGTAAGFVAALFAAILSADRGVLGNAANTETFMMLPLTAGLWTTLRAAEKDSVRWAFVTGLCGTAAMLFKQQAAFSFAFCLGYLLWVSPRRLTLAAAMILGGLVLTLPVVGYFWATGALAPFYDCVIGYNLKYTQQVPLHLYPKFFWDRFRVILIVAWPAYLLAALAAVIGAWGRQAAADLVRARSTRVVLGWLACSLVGITVSGLFRHHYFIQIIPAVCLLAGRGAQLVAGLFRDERVRLSLPYGLAVAGLLVGVLSAPDYYLSDSPNRIARNIYNVNPFPESPEVARFIAAHTAPDDPIFVFGSEPQIYYYAHRKCASRYIFVYPLFTSFPDTRSRQESMLEELRQHPPRFIVFVIPDQVPASFLATKKSPLAGFFSDFTKLLEQYKVVGLVPHVVDPLKPRDDPTFPLYTGADLERIRRFVPLQYIVLQVWQWQRPAR